MAERVAINQELAAWAEASVRDGTFEGMVQMLRRDFPTDADDAVAHAYEKLIQRPEAPRDPGLYVWVSARNEARRLVRRRARDQSIDALADDEDGSGWEPASSSPSVEEEAARRDVYRRLHEHVESWETKNVRVVTLIYLEAAFRDDVVSSAEVAELASGILGHQVDAAFVRTWKSRGLAKLKAYPPALELGAAD